MSKEEKAAEEKEALTGKKEGGYGAVDDGGESGDAGVEADVPLTPRSAGKFASKSKAWFW